MALMKLCKCGKKIEYSKQMCQVCFAKMEQQQKVYNSHYDKYKRDRKSTEFYHSVQWIALRDEILKRFNGIDVYEYVENKRIVPANTVHHIVELKEDRSRGLDVSNLIPVSDKTHGKLHGMYKYNKKKTQDKLFRVVSEYIRGMNG